MKVIDLLNKIANGEETPKKFKFAECIFEKSGYYYLNEDGDDLFESMFGDFSNINDEIEIIKEPKQLEKIKWTERESLAGQLSDHNKLDILARRTEKLKTTLNEIIGKMGENE